MDLNYVGLQISELTKLQEFVACLPSDIAPTIDRQLQNLESAAVSDQIDAVQKAIVTLRTRTPKTFGEFIGYVALTAAISLIKERTLLMDKCALMSHLYDSDVYIDQWKDDLTKICGVAQTVWRICASRVDNLRQVISVISVRSEFTFSASVLLLSAVMDALTVDNDIIEPKTFQMHELSKFVQIYNKINAIDDCNRRVNRIFQFLTLFSDYQSLVYLRQPQTRIAGMEEYFTARPADLQELQLCLRRLYSELNVSINKNQQVEYLMITELIEYDLLPGLELLLEDTH